MKKLILVAVIGLFLVYGIGVFNGSKSNTLQAEECWEELSYATQDKALDQLNYYKSLLGSENVSTGVYICYSSGTRAYCITIWYDCDSGPGTQKSITVTSPNGGEDLQAGTSLNITWSSTGFANNYDVYIYYSTDGGLNWVYITSYTNNNLNGGSSNWNVPDTQTDSAMVGVIISSSSGQIQDTSDSYFTIYKLTDNDGDGYMAEIDDCDDTNPAINPGTIEVLYNGIDDDCNELTPDTRGVVHVDFTYTGIENGTIDEPYNTLAEAINAVDEDGEIIINAGTTNETPIISKPLTIKSAGGDVIIGK